MIETFVYILIITTGALLSYKYYNIAKIFCARKEKDPCVLAYITSYMFGMSLSVAFILSLYRHYVWGYLYKPWIVGVTVFLGVLPFFIFNLQQED